MDNLTPSEPLSGQEREIAGSLADANHILSSQEVLDAFGHVSVRSPENSQFFLLSRNLAPALVQPTDVQRFTLEAETDDPRRSYLERYIHAAIYRARPEVAAVVHSHSLGVVPYSTVERPLRPVMHMAGFLPPKTPVFEIREQSGDETDLLIRSNRQGDDLAARLGGGSVALMRGHGSVVVGTSLKEAVFNAVYTEKNARVQAQAESLGRVSYLTPAEACAAAKTNSSQVNRAWDYWLEHPTDNNYPPTQR